MFKFAQHGTVGHVGQRAAAAHREDRRRHLRHQIDAHRGDQPRPGDHVHPDRLPAAGPAEHGRVAQLRPRQREPEPAGVRRAALAGARDQRPISRSSRGSGASGFLPSSYQGVQFRAGGDPVLYLAEPAGRRRARRAAQMLDALAQLNAMQHDALRRSGDRDAHRAVRDGVPHADLGAGADGPVEGAGRTSSSCTAPSRASPARSPPTACSRAGWPSAACASSSSITAAGTSTATCRATSRCSAATPISRRAALVTDLKQRGLLDDTLVVWGGEFGRTVYRQGKLTDDNYGRDHHPRCFSHLAGRRRHQARHRATARPTTSATTSSRIRCTSTTCRRRSCTCWASTTPS